MDRYAAVLIGAAAGGLARYAITVILSEKFPGRFPLATLVINVTGCFLIGMLTTIFTERPGFHPNWRLLLVVGVLGGYTTFSTFGWDTYASVRDGRPLIGLANVLLSVIFGYLAVWLGSVLVRR